MKKRLFLPLLLTVAVLSGAAAQTAARLAVGPSDTLREVLARHVGKSVTLELTSGDELTGVVRLSGEVVHLEQLAGKEFFDAAVDIDAVAAVIVRVR